MIARFLAILLALFLLNFSAGCVATATLALYAATPERSFDDFVAIDAAWIDDEKAVVAFRAFLESRGPEGASEAERLASADACWIALPLRDAQADGRAVGPDAPGERAASDDGSASLSVRWESVEPRFLERDTLRSGSPPASLVAGMRAVALLDLRKPSGAPDASYQERVAQSAAKSGALVYVPHIDDSSARVNLDEVSFGVARFDSATRTAIRDDFVVRLGPIRSPRLPWLLLLPVAMVVDVVMLPYWIVVATFGSGGESAVAAGDH
jgi:hypothetical protein